MEDITRRDILEAISLFSTSVDNQFSDIRQDISIIQQDVSVLKQDVSVLKQDVSVLKQDVSVLKYDMNGVKSTMATKSYLDEKIGNERGDRVEMVKKMMQK